MRPSLEKPEIGFNCGLQVCHIVCDAIGAKDAPLARGQITITVWRQIVVSAGLFRRGAVTCRKGVRGSHDGIA
jgi:hypothetical protein